jgi:hypothetical protein
MPAKIGFTSSAPELQALTGAVTIVLLKRTSERISLPEIGFDEREAGLINWAEI